MNYRIKNRLLKKDSRRVILPHLYWGALALVIAVPSGFLFGLQSASSPEAMEVLMKTMQERASAPLPIREASPEVMGYLSPFGRTKVEYAVAQGNEVWTTAYVLKGESPGEAHQRLFEAWRGMGLDAEIAEQGVAAPMPDGRGVLMGQVIGDGALRLFCWPGGRADGLKEISPEQRMAESGLPALKRGVALEDLSQDDGGFIFHVTGRGKLEPFLADYRGRLFGEGWEYLDMNAALDPKLRAQGVEMYRKDGRQLMLSGKQLDPTTTLMTLVVF